VRQQAFAGRISAAAAALGGGGGRMYSQIICEEFRDIQSMGLRGR
jgi:hypothetical protein